MEKILYMMEKRLYMMEKRSGAICSLVASPKIANNTVGEKVTAEQLIEECIIMTIFKAMIMNIGITSVSSRPTPAYIYYYYTTHRSLCIMHLEY